MNKNIAVLKPITAGTPILDCLTVARMNAIQDAILELWAGENLRSGGNVQIMPSGNGPTVNVLAGGGSGGSGTEPVVASGSFKISWVTPPTSEAPGTIKLARGTVGNSIPDNIGSTFEVASTGTYRVFLKLMLVETSYVGVVQSSTIIVVPSTAETQPEDTIAMAHILVGEIIDGAIHQYVSGSLQYALQRFDSLDDPELDPEFYHTWGRI